MRFCLLLFVLTSLIAFSQALLKEKPKRLRVTAENQWELGLPLGTVLTLDQRTRLYQPPPLMDNFTADDRIELMWNNPNTNQNYCKVGPGIDSTRLFYNFWRHQWCKNSTGHDICCRGHKCSCNSIKANCACLTSEGYEYWEHKKEVDWQKVKRVGETIRNFNGLNQLYNHAKNKGTETKIATTRMPLGSVVGRLLSTVFRG